MTINTFEKRLAYKTSHYNTHLTPFCLIYRGKKNDKEVIDNNE